MVRPFVSLKSVRSEGVWRWTEGRLVGSGLPLYTASIASISPFVAPKAKRPFVVREVFPSILLNRPLQSNGATFDRLT